MVGAKIFQATIGSLDPKGITNHEVIAARAGRPAGRPCRITAWFAVIRIGYSIPKGQGWTGAESCRLHHLKSSGLELVGVDGWGALHALGSWLQRSVRRIFGITLGCGYGIRLVVLRAVGRVERVGSGIELGSSH
jgi:hypothetical protein